MNSIRLSLCTAIALCVAGTGVAQVSAPVAAIDPDGTLHAQGFTAPFSSFASAEARQQFIQTHQPGHTSAAMAGVDHGDINQLRKAMDAGLGPKIEHAKALYPVKVESWTVGGVYTDIVTPADGMPAKNKDRVLINLHGGGFAFGARTIGLMESIPIASVAKMKIVTIDYRQGPENHFPAASEDVTTVYREILKQYKPENIGIFGCSAGGMLTGQSLAWFQTHQLPRPGAAGIFCAGAGSSEEGDSLYFAAAMNGQKPPPPPPAGAPPTNPMAYLEHADLKDPMVAPFVSPAIMAKFPPTLIVTATRDIAMSPAIATHQELVRLGVDADLHVWDGLQHSFFTDIDLPESKEYFNVVAKFFDKHLGEDGTMTSVKIDAIDGSGRFDAYLATPAGSGKVPAVIVIQEIRGVNTNIRAICDDYAARGYLAAAPDMLWRIEPNLEFDPDTKEGWDTAMRLNAAFDENKGADDLVATLHWLRNHPRSNGKVGTVGYCLGGKLAYLFAVRSDVDVAVGYYGIGIDKCLSEATDATCPLMLHVAGEDRFVPPDAQQRIKQGLAPFDDTEVHIYPGADHAFARVDGIRYDDAAARLANRRTAAFIDGHLKGDAR